MRGITQHPLAVGAAALLLLLAGCTPAQDQRPTPSPSSPEVSSAPPTPTAPGATASIPTMQPSGSDHIPETSAPEPGSETETPTGPTTTAALSIYYVAVGDQGKSGPEFGCGDSIVSTRSAPQPFTDKVKAAVGLLLADRSAQHGQSGLTNALAGSSLSFVSARVGGDTVTVNLRGRVSSGGECDDPRIIEQISRTASTAAGVSKARITVEGIPITKVLSGKGMNSK